MVWKVQVLIPLHRPRSWLGPRLFHLYLLILLWRVWNPLSLVLWRVQRVPNMVLWRVQRVRNMVGKVQVLGVRRRPQSLPGLHLFHQHLSVLHGMVQSPLFLLY